MIVSYYIREKLRSYATTASYKKIKEFLHEDGHYVALTIYEKSDLRNIMSNLSRLMTICDIKDIIHNLQKNRHSEIYLGKSKESILKYEVIINNEKSAG